jgi:hypothetical protein
LQLRELASRLATAFPQFPPYNGRYDDVTPHLTQDRRSATVTLATVRASIGHVLPLTVTVDRIELQWWPTTAADGCTRGNWAATQTLGRDVSAAA